MRATRALEPFQGVAATGLAIANFQTLLGNTWEQISLWLGGTTFTKAMLTRLVLKLNQKVIWDITGTHLNTINLYNGHPTVATGLSLMFHEPRAITKRGRLAGAIDTSYGIQGVTLEATITGATAPTLAAEVKMSPPLSRETDPGLVALSKLVRCLLPSPIVTSAAVTRAPLNINLGTVAGALVKRLYIFHSTITEVNVKRNGVDIIEGLTPTKNNFYQDEIGHDPQAGMFVVDFIEDDDLDNAMPTVNPDGTIAGIQVLVSDSAADTITVYADLLAPPALL